MVVVLCGGGSAGHVLPNLGLIEYLSEKFPTHQLAYIIEQNGVEAGILKAYPDLSLHPIYAGKIRRYLSVKNLLDLFKIPVGIIQSYLTLRRIKAKLVISKGGYVSVPVIIAAYLLRIPVIHHESDASPSLTSKLACRLASELWFQYEQASLDHKNTYTIELPMRRSIAQAKKQDFTYHKYLDPNKKTLLVMGGSLGAKFLNDFVNQHLDLILQQYNVIHLTGLKQPEVPKPKPSYVPLKFVSQMGSIYQTADFFLGRAGATTLSELAFYGLRSILVPLPLNASRGEQFENAQAFSKQYPASVIMQSEFNLQTFTAAIKDLTKRSGAKSQKSTSISQQLLFTRLSHYLADDQ